MLTYALIATLLSAPHGHAAPVHMVLKSDMLPWVCRGAKAGYRDQLAALERKLGAKIKLTCEVDGALE